MQHNTLIAFPKMNLFWLKCFYETFVIVSILFQYMIADSELSQEYAPTTRNF